MCAGVFLHIIGCLHGPSTLSWSDLWYYCDITRDKRLPGYKQNRGTKNFATRNQETTSVIIPPLIVLFIKVWYKNEQAFQSYYTLYKKRWSGPVDRETTATWLPLSSCYFNGNMEDLIEMPHYPSNKLQELHLGENNITGFMPSQMAHLASLGH